MDIVLEVFDTLLADRLYATLLPASLSSSTTFASKYDANSTLSFFSDAQSYLYEPSSRYLYLEPSKYAYMSAWPRDNIYRQAVSLYLITWYAAPCTVC
jgi:lathosterol oxidase